MKTSVPFNDLTKTHDFIKNEIDQAIRKVIRSSSYILGEEGEAFENNFAKYLETKHVIGTNSCSDALEIILRCWGIGKGNEVMMQANTWISIYAAVRLAGATPVFLDTNLHDPFINLTDLENKITDNTKVICVTHLFGYPEKVDEIKKLIAGRNIKLLEDAAHAHGATYKGRKTGSLGDAAAFSFYPTKNLGALGDAGCIATADDDLGREARIWRNHGQQKRDHYLHYGKNSRMDELQAAILNVKLRYLDIWNTERKQLAERYFMELPSACIIGHFHQEAVYHLFPVKTEKRALLTQKLDREGIGWGIHYPSVLSALEENEASTPNARLWADSILSLPIYPGLDQNLQSRVVAAVSGFLK